MYMNYRWLIAWTVVLIVLSIGPGTATRQNVVQAQTSERCFAETNQCISGPIRAYWENNGGLSVFGYPITPQRIEVVEGQSLEVQWFQRDRLEDHGPDGVLAGRLGARLLELEGRPWETYAKVTADQVPPSCQFVPQTGHSMCDPFLSYWQANGGLERFGYPITQPVSEMLEGQEYTVQYYERRRMEIHPEIAGSPILLGLLGTRVLFLEDNPDLAVTATPQGTATPTTTATPTPTPECDEAIIAEVRDAYNRAREELRDQLGCPVPGYSVDIPAAAQNFENGKMIWVDRGERRSEGLVSGRYIYAIINPGPTFRKYADDWEEGVDPEQPDVTPPEDDLYTPRRGFGQVWINDPTLRDAIGWAIEPQEQSRRADVQDFEGGTIIKIRETGIVYVFGDPDNEEQVQVIAP